MKTRFAILGLALLAALPASAVVRTNGTASAITASISEADIKAVIAGIINSGALDAGDYGGEWFYRQSYYRIPRFDVDLLAGDRLQATMDLNVKWNTNLQLIQMNMSETGKGTVILRHPFRVVEENGTLVVNLCVDDIESMNVTVPFVNWAWDWDATARSYLRKFGCVKIGSFSNNLPLVPAFMRKGLPTVTAYDDRLELKYGFNHYPVNLAPILGLLLQ